MAKKPIFTFIGLIFKLGFLLITLYLVFHVGKYAYQYTYKIAIQPSPEQRSVRDLEVTIPKGSSTKIIAEILEEKDLIANAYVFRLKSRVEKYDGSFKPGTFILNTGMSEEEIMEILRTGGMYAEGSRFTIPEGYTTESIAKKLDKEKIVTASDFLRAVNEGDFDYDFIKKIPERNMRLEGYLFPDTYEVRSEATSEEIISKMLKRFDDIYKSEYYIRAEELGYTMDEIIIIASIIESEARREEERPTIAGVIYNRLDQNMKLQMCSSVMYALGKRKDRLLFTDLEIESPYNTYKYVGLPQGPISNPGEASIIAALYPEEHNYLFFVLKNEETGEHVFTETGEEHLKAKQKYNQKF